MKATPETRQRMLVAITATLTPLVLWIVVGLYDRLVPSPFFQGFSSRGALSPEGARRQAQTRDALINAAMEGEWAVVAKRADETCGSECPPLILPLQAEAHWRLGDRMQAASLWSRTLSWESPVAQADFQALKGDKKTYVSFVAPLLVTPGRVQSNDIAWACVIMPDALPDYAPVVRMAEKALQEAAVPEARANVLNTLGVALYRAGRFPEAIQNLEESERAKKDMMNTIFLALSYHKLGKKEKSRHLAESFYAFLRTSLPSNDRYRVEHILFEQELRAALPPATKATQQ